MRSSREKMIPDTRRTSSSPFPSLSVTSFFLYLEKKVTLDAKMLKYGNGLSNAQSGSSSYVYAVDGQTGQGWTKCANSARSPSGPVVLSIDLGHLYSVNKIKMLSRFGFGSGSLVYVGQTPIQANGNIDQTKDYKCGGSYPSGTAPVDFTDFVCSTIHWVRYVSIWRKVNYAAGYYFCTYVKLKCIIMKTKVEHETVEESATTRIVLFI